MWDALVKFIFGFNIIEVILAMVLTVLAFYFNLVKNYDHLPFKENNAYIIGIALFGVIILLIQLLKLYFKKLKEAKEKIENEKRNFDEALRFYQDKVDSLTSSELKFVVTLLNNENKVFYSYKLEDNYNLLNSKFFTRFECVDEEVLKDYQSKNVVHIQGMNVLKIIGYQLEKGFYDMLLYSYYKYGKISVSGREKHMLDKKQNKI